jgi:hypothetical protein
MEKVRIRGYKQFLRAVNRADKATKHAVKAELRRVGDAVKSDAAARLSQYDAGSAAGLRTRVRVRGVAVEQSLRKTTGLRPDYGALQMTRALLPAVRENEQRTEQAMEAAIDRVADIFER